MEETWIISGRMPVYTHGCIKLPPTNASHSWSNSEAQIGHFLSDVETGLANKLQSDPHYDVGKIEWKLQNAILSLPEKHRPYSTCVIMMKCHMKK